MMEHTKHVTAPKVSVSRRMQMFAICAALLLVLSVLFTWLMYASFESQYRNMQSQYYELVTGQVINNVEDSLHYGKELQRYYGMDDLLAGLSEYLPAQMEMFVLDRAGDTLYSRGADAALEAEYVDSGLITYILARGERGTMRSTQFEDGELLFAMPIFNAEGSADGCLALKLSGSVYQQVFDAELTQMMLTAAVIVVISLMLLLVFTLIMPLRKGVRRLTMACSVLLVLSILIQGTAGYRQLEQEYRKTMMNCGNDIARYMGDVIEQVREKGVDYSEMEGFSEYLASRIQNTSLLWNMKMVHMMADSDAELMRGSQNNYFIPIGTEADSGYFILFEISNDYMNGMMLELFLTFCITLIVMMVVMMEINKLPKLWMERDMLGGESERHDQSVQLRLATFLVYTANYLSIPYSAAVIRAMGQPLFGLTLEATAALPVTIEVFVLMAFMLLLQRRLGRFANKSLGIAAFGLLILGNLGSAFAATPAALLACRALCGVGMAVYKVFTNRVAAFGEREDVEANVGSINAGVLGGIMCGGALGAVVSGALGNSMTYIFTLVLLAITGVLMLSIISREVKEAKDVQEQQRGSVFGLLKDKQVLLVMICVIVPLNIGMMFIVSFLPQFVQNTSSGGLLTSYGYIVNGLAGIYLGQALVSWARGRLSTRASLSILMGLAIVALLLLGSGISVVAAALAACALMGIFDVCGNPAAASAYLRLPAVTKVNTAAALTVMMVLGSLAQTAAPLLFSVMIANMQTAGAMSALLPAIIFLAVDMLLIMVFLRDKKQDIPA